MTVTSLGEWGRALHALQAGELLDDGGLGVRRVEARPDGSQVWTLEGDGGAAWYVFEGGALRRVHPELDERLPGAALLESGVLSWRPGRRAVVDGADAQSVRKLFRPKRLGSAVRRHERVASVNGCLGPWHVPEILSVDSETASVVFERVPGLELSLNDAGSGAWRMVGAGLRAFQSEVPLEGLPEHDRRAELESIAEMHRRHVTLFGERLEGVDELLGGLMAHVRASTGPLVAAHRDLHDGQILLDGERVHVLDFDNLCAAERVLDPGNLTAHLVLRELQRNGADDAELARRSALDLVAGYGAPNTDAFHDGLRFYQAATFARLAILYSLRPRWRRCCPTLIQYARASLRGLSHA